ncbi:hypothetical protein FD755_022132 [Muntiacus reevesi]|uniref:Core shell protein Gag P30 domain-containing protein n=1 Tax=Muntiacus reevesi TaxID=9886 RepID=A0A5N3W2V1_MUNRE|nr:hypothetical protein FD755_022132 [Muntiacus reevesi]
MGGSSSKPTVLDGMIKNFKNRSFVIYERAWPAFDAVWPPEGTLDLPTVQALHQVVTGTPGRSDQFPHRAWLLTAQTLPTWARFCMNGQGQSRVSVAQPLRRKKEEGEKPIFQGDPVEDPLLPPPYVPLTPQAPTQPALDPLPDSPPPPPPPPVSPAPPREQESRPESGGKRLCSTKRSNQRAMAHQMPLQETQGLQQVNEDGSVQPGRSILYYQPVSSTDLLSWKHHDPAYSDRPQAVTDLLEFVSHTHQPAWDDSMPEMRAGWDFNTREGQETLSRYRDALLHGLRGEPKKPPIYPHRFLCEVFRTYTPFDPEIAKNQHVISTAFVAQSYADIQRKLQKLEGFTGMNAT